MRKGNCVDKFIEKRLDQDIKVILDNVASLNERIENRTNNVDYFNDVCYEKDFNNIIRIKYAAKQIVSNCDKFLERISEQYSKLNV